MLRSALCLGAAMLVLGGCSSLAGTWKLAPGQPATDVSVAVMTLAGDGTFTAQADYGSRSEVMSGFYSYSDGTLEFETNGQTRTYGAVQDGDKLTITTGRTSARMVRMKR